MLGDALDVWLWWRDRLRAGWVRYVDIEDELSYAARLARSSIPLLLTWWFMRLIELQGCRERFSAGEPVLIEVPVEGRNPKFWRLDDEGLKHISSGAIFYDLGLRLDRALVQLAAEDASALRSAFRVQVFTAGYRLDDAEKEGLSASFAAALVSTLGKLVGRDPAAEAAEAVVAVADSAPAAPKLPDREEAILRIIASGKVPTKNGYSDKKFIAEVLDLTGASPDDVGYKRDQLRRLYAKLSTRH
jgi:hypothetical protein